MKVIAVSGSVGTGKTTLAKRLSGKLGFKYLDANNVIKENKLSEGYDRKRRCRIVDTKKLVICLVKEIRKSNEKGIVIDSHFSHYLPEKYVDVCVITKCSLKTLKKRLGKRGYGRDKVRENLDCEIFDLCLNEAKEKKHKVLLVDTTKGINMKPILSKIK